MADFVSAYFLKKSYKDCVVCYEFDILTWFPKSRVDVMGGPIQELNRSVRGLNS